MLRTIGILSCLKYAVAWTLFASCSVAVTNTTNAMLERKEFTLSCMSRSQSITGGKSGLEAEGRTSCYSRQHSLQPRNSLTAKKNSRHHGGSLLDGSLMSLLLAGFQTWLRKTCLRVALLEVYRILFYH